MNRINYQKELELLLDRLSQSAGEGMEPPSLLLHSCCAPCSSYVLEYLCGRFGITVFYYNPNITEDREYRLRAAEQKRLIETYNREGRGYPIRVVEGDYEPRRFWEAAAGLEDCPEGGDRCLRCFDLRLRETAKRAKDGQFDFFGTTLTISPLKDAETINGIGRGLEAEYGVSWLPSDFKKKDGYKRVRKVRSQHEENFGFIVGRNGKGF